MGLLSASQQAYYANDDYGNYQFLHLTDVISNFMVSYVGRDKLINNVGRTDVAFHAQRALQELSYDTLRSCKSIEVEVCGNLKVPLPQDYVNYVKLTSSDSSGIEHILYPTSKTSNPFAIEQTQANCTDCGDTSDTYQYDGTELKPQEIDCGTEDVTCTLGTTGLVDGYETTHKAAGSVRTYVDSQIVSGIWTMKRAAEYWQTYLGLIDTFCTCLQTNEADVNCGEYLGWDNFDPFSDTYYTDQQLSTPTGVNKINLHWMMGTQGGWSNLRIKATNPNAPVFNRETIMDGGWADVTTTVRAFTESSNTWDNYKTSGSFSNDTSTTSDTKDTDINSHIGQRYGLDPQYSQTNGSYFIDCNKGVIHFSSNLSGKTIILKYISDGLGTDEEMVLHKFAEEAMYKWIAYAILSTRINTPEQIIQRFKKEKFAETRKAKLRLSNIKLEEITQIFRGKSKHIKH